MDLNHLRSFATVAQYGHLTRAAEALHLSQPALSAHIKTLEEELGVTLFDRSSSGMTLTPSGRHLLGEAEAIIAAVAHLKHAAQALSGKPTGNLKLGTVLEPAVLRVGDLLVRARDEFPQIEIELSQVMSSDALQGVREGTLDASFYFGPQPDDGLLAIPLREIVYCVAMPATWADELSAAPWEAIAERPWIVAPEPSSHRQLVMELFRDHGPLPERVVEADNESLITNLVETAVGASLVREEIAVPAAEAGRMALWPGASVTTRLWLVHAADRESDPLLAALRELLREVWAIGPAGALAS